ncbi:cysteine-rich outer membrane protein [Chlamydia sp.]|uniref:cysteine-rich outer membrane protein n=1 Tax=Chlamydia sp. TaxID=35827 RepID=UPI0025BE6F4D|nr:cysteine-rich outer membrane protein [Chlamydia sp.]MBQ8498659.1 hypothetical protein [Chlamydia sp.]
MSVEPVIPGVASPNSEQTISNETTQTKSAKSCIVEFLSSTAFKVGLVVLGILLVMASIASMVFVAPPVVSMASMIYLAIPAILGCVNICVGILSMEGYCSPTKWMFCKKVLKTSEDLLDDGKLNDSNKIFTEQRLDEIGNIIEATSSRRNSLVS